MRIVTFTSLFPNSIDPTHGIFVYQRSAHLANRPGNEVTVVSPVPYFPRWLKTRRWRAASSIAPQEQMGELKVYYPRYFLLPKIWMPVHAVSMFLGCLPRVMKLNKRAKIDCMDAHFVYPDGCAAVLLGKMLGIPVVVSARGTDINLFPQFWLIRPMIRWTLRQASGAIAVSAALKDSMIRLGAAPNKIRVIPNGVDRSRFQPIAAGEARRQLNMSGSGEVVVSVGSLLPAKGHQMLIRAVKQMAPRYPNLRLYILGEGPYRPQLETLVGELGLRDRVQLIGKRPNEELQLWFSAATASCLASAREGWPNVVTESLACGTPVVATRVGGIPEIIRNSELGILVDQTVESITAGLEDALSRNWDRQAISEQTRARTWEMVGEEVEEFFGQVLHDSDHEGTGDTEEQATKVP